MKSILSPSVNVSSFAPSKGFPRPEGAQLGINTKSSPPPPKTVDKTRFKRFQMLSVAQYLFRSEAEKRGLMPFDLHRVSKCSHVRIKNQVSINTNKDTKKAFYSDLAVCGSVWGCPVCAAKIQEKRRKEVSQVMQSAYKSGLTCHMVTLTFPHTSYQSCSELLEKQSEALKYLRKGGAFTDKYLKKKLGYKGVIRSLEVVHGKNGWHPHTHEIWVCDKNADFSDMKDRIVKKWSESLIKAGVLSSTDSSKLAQVKKYSVDIHFNADTSDYLAKHDDDSYLQATGKHRSGQWGADHEVSKSSNKAKSSGRHPFQLLADFAEKPNKTDARLFIEYLEAFTQKRKRQIYIAPALRLLAGLGSDASDQDIAEAEEKPFELSAVLSSFDWFVITNKKAQPLILDIFEGSGLPSVRQWLLDNGGGFNIFDSSYTSSATVYVNDPAYEF